MELAARVSPRKGLPALIGFGNLHPDGFGGGVHIEKDVVISC